MMDCENNDLKSLIDYLNNENTDFNREMFLIGVTVTAIAISNCAIVGVISSVLTIAGDSFKNEIKKIFSLFKKSASLEDTAKNEKEMCEFADVALARLTALYTFKDKIVFDVKDRFIMEWKIKSELQQDKKKEIEKLDENREKKYASIFRNKKKFDREEYWKDLIKDVGSILEGNKDEYEKELLKTFKETYKSFRQKLIKESKCYSSYIQNLDSSKINDMHGGMLNNSKIDILKNTDWMITYLNEKAENLYYTEKNIDIFNKVYKEVIEVKDWKEDIRFNIINLEKELEKLVRIKAQVGIVKSFLDNGKEFLDKSLPYIDIQKELLEKYYECCNNLKLNNIEKREIEYEDQYILMKKLDELKNQIESSFRRIIVVKGETGSGKSHLLKEFCNNIYSNIHNNYIYFISLEININDESIENSLVKSINRILEVNVKSLKDFNQKLINGDKIKIYFVIDDIHKYVKTNKKVNDFFNTIRRTTVFPWVYWIITVHAFKMDILIDNKKIISGYCIDFEKDFQDEFLFIDLKKYTQRFRLGEKIIESYGISVSNLEPNKENELYYNPLFAHIFSTTQIKDYEIYKVLSYSEFYVKFSEYIIRKIINSSERIIDLNLLKNQVEQDLNNFVKYIIGFHKLEYIQEEWEELPTNLNELKKELIDTFLIRIKTREYVSPYFENKTHTKLEFKLIYDFFWMFEIILNIGFDDLEVKIEKISKFEYETSIELFLILFICADNNKKRKEISLIIEKLKDTPKYRKVLFIGSIYGHEKTRRSTLYHLNNFIGEIYDKNEMFNILIFISSLKPCELSQSKQCQLLVKYYNKVLEKDLISYFNIVASEKIDKIDSKAELKKCIKYFIYCNNEEFVNLIPEKFCRKILKFFEKDMNKENKILDYLINDIILNAQYKLEINDIIEKFEKIDGLTFIEKLIRNITRNIIENIGIEYNDILMKRDYYNLNNTIDNRCKATILMFRRSVTIEFGRYYRKSGNSKFKVEYRKITEDMINNANPVSKKIAFHLIINTVENDKVQYLDEEFIPQMRELNEDIEIKDFINERRDVFDRVFLKK